MKRPGTLKGAQQGVLHEVLSLMSVRRYRAGIPQQARNLGSESATNLQLAHTATLLRNGALRSGGTDLLFWHSTEPQ